VVIPHEFFELAPEHGAPTPGHLRRTVGLCVEQPETSWFWISCHYAKQLGAVVDIRPSAVSRMRRLGLAAEHGPLGYTPRWDRWLDLEPLVRGEHLVTGRAESLALLASHLLEDPERLASMRLAAYDLIRAQAPMTVGAVRLAEIAGTLASVPLRRMSKEPLSP